MSDWNVLFPKIDKPTPLHGRPDLYFFYPLGIALACFGCVVAALVML